MKVKAQDLSAAIKNCALAMPSINIVPIMDFVLVDADSKNIQAVCERFEYEERIEIAGSGQILLHRSAFPVIHSIPSSDSIILEKKKMLWNGGSLELIYQDPKHFKIPDKVKADLFFRIDSADLKAAISKLNGLLDPKENELSGYFPLWIQDGHLCGGSSFSVGAIPLGIPPTSDSIPFPRESFRQIQAWIDGIQQVSVSSKSLVFSGENKGFSITKGHFASRAFIAMLNMVRSKANEGGLLQVNSSVIDAVKMVVNASPDKIDLEFGKDSLTISGFLGINGFELGGQKVMQRIDCVCSLDQTIRVQSKTFLNNLIHASELRIANHNNGHQTIPALFLSGTDWMSSIAPIVV